MSSRRDLRMQARAAWAATLGAPVKIGRQLARKVHTGWKAGGSAPQRTWNAGALVALEIQRWVVPRADMALPILVRSKQGHRPILVGGGSDEEVFEEVFVDREYELAPSVDPRVILDVGGNVGYAAIYFALRYPDATIYTFEPDPTNYAKLERNIRPFPSIRPYRIALGARNAEGTLYVQQLRGISSSLHQRPGFEPIPVRVVALDTFLDQEGIDRVDLLKFDIEGGERELFGGLQSLAKIDAVIGEVHEDLMRTSLADFLELLPGFQLESRPIAEDRFLVFGRAA